MTLTPGSTQTIEIACGKHISSWGSKPDKDACPNDQGSYHAGGQGNGGWGGNQESNLMGCALAIAYKSDARSVKPEDFIVMSVQERCVRQRDTPFEIPSNLPACPEGGCTCAWFWAGQNSAEEMYMTGFKCDVKGGAVGGNIPKPRRPRQNGNSDAATQPYYWANHGGQNVDWEVGWTTRPKYNGKMGWNNGAQEKAFAGSGGNTPASSTKSKAEPTSTSSSKGVNPPRPTEQNNNNGPDFPVHAADPTHPSSATGNNAPANTDTSGGSKTCKKVRRRRRSMQGHAHAGRAATH